MLTVSLTRLPMCVTTALWPLGKLTTKLTVEVIVVSKEMDWTMWSVAPVSKIQSWEEIVEGGVKLAEKTECSREIVEPRNSPAMWSKAAKVNDCGYRGAN